MTYVYGLIRVAASTFAVAAGLLGWPLWTLAIAIPVHTAASYFFSKSLYDEMLARLDRDGASREQREWAKFYQAFWVRELALAFVKLGIGYAIGFWIGNVLAVPSTPGPAA